MWDGISYSFPHFNSASVEVWAWVINFIPHFIPFQEYQTRSLSLGMLVSGVWLFILGGIEVNPSNGFVTQQVVSLDYYWLNHVSLSHVVCTLCISKWSKSPMEPHQRKEIEKNEWPKEFKKILSYFCIQGEVHVRLEYPLLCDNALYIGHP